VHASSLTWVDSHTVEFNLTGQFLSSGTVDVSIPANAIQSITGTSNSAYSDSIVLKIAPVVVSSPTPTPTSTGTTTPTPTPSPTPAAAPKPAPKGPLHKAKTIVHHVKKVVKHVVAPKPKPKAKPVVHKPAPKVVVKKK
jgi:hypothetical protein